MPTLIVNANTVASDLIIGAGTFCDYDSANVYGCLQATSIMHGGMVEVYTGGTVTDIFMEGDADSGGTRALMSVEGRSEQNQVSNGAELTLVKDSGATDQGTIILQGGIFNVYNTCVATDNQIQGGKQTLFKGGLAIGATITAGEQQVWSGATASGTYIQNGTLRLENGNAVAENIVMENGSIALGTDSILRNAIMKGGNLTKAGYSDYFTIENLTMLPGTSATIYAESTLLGDFYLSGSMDLTGRILGKTPTPVHASGADFWFCLENLDGTSSNAIVKSSIVQDEMATCHVTVSAEQASGLYILAEGSDGFLNSLDNLPLLSLGLEDTATLVIGTTVSLPTADFAYSIQDGKLQLAVTANNTPYIKATSNYVAWANIAPTEDIYVCKIAPSGHDGALALSVSEKRVDIYGLTNGNYDIQVQETTATLEVTDAEETPQTLVSTANNRYDLFFANPKGTWTYEYYAEHRGFAGGWEGTRETVHLVSKNRFPDLFLGSEDINILMLTDDAKGDAIFAEDIYTLLPEGESQQSRLSSIYEIHGGLGNDVVDMTGQVYSYASSHPLAILGGDGNDYLWNGACNGILYGDNGNDHLVGGPLTDYLMGGSGDDILHGGGGEDLFCFCQDWGNDTLYQLSGDGNSAALWFAEGITLQDYQPTDTVLTDGVNTVQLADGLTVGDVTIFIGSAVNPEVYASLEQNYVFSPYASVQIYESEYAITSL